MLSFSLDVYGFEGVLSHLAEVEYRLFDLRPLAEEIKLEMAHQNHLARTLGLDRDGEPFIELAASTWKKRERQGRRGPPLAPDGGASDVVHMDVQVEEAHPDDITVRGTWPHAWWVGLHTRRWGNRPERNAVGFTPDSWARVGVLFDDHVARALGL
jgi:hypothetical protein